MNKGNEILSGLLSTKVLANITDISPGNVIWGQHLRTRASKRSEFPMEVFEDFERKRGAISGHRYPCVEVATGGFIHRDIPHDAIR